MTNRAKALVAVGVAAAVAIGGTIAISAASATTAQGSASMASGSSGADTTTHGSTTAQVPAAPGAGAPGAGAPGAGAPGGFGGRGGEFGLLLGALHGDFVVAASTGSGTVTERLQRGQVTAVGSESLTVRSTDGYSSDYTVPADLDVTGITSGATVLVIGTVDGTTVTASLISDGMMAGGGFGNGAVPGGGVPDGSGSGRGADLPQTTSSAPTTA